MNRITLGYSIDIHQHLWPEPLLNALAARHDPPMLGRGAGGWAPAVSAASAGAAASALDALTNPRLVMRGIFLLPPLSGNDLRS